MYEPYKPTKSDLIVREIFDLDYRMGTHPINKDIRKRANIEAIKQSIKTLVLLNHYEKPFHPDIGCDIYKSLFEPFDDVFGTTLMSKDIIKILTNYEPRATIQDVIINADPDNYTLDIRIEFIPESGSEVETIDLFLKTLR